ncbi:unnamed protein product [Eruca vesicaria subsp. sativa]|uniref:Uncharacterized protein n=1 Tax=Eruca vesicaria subsp. sativa TaxID=29727 RepID=A0ABC8JCY1_ERUVS|nr:unnamed protein product [Eruca vesicaria subsp. sativa]
MAFKMDYIWPGSMIEKLDKQTSLNPSAVSKIVLCICLSGIEKNNYIYNEKVGVCPSAIQLKSYIKAFVLSVYPFFVLVISTCVITSSFHGHHKLMMVLNE